MLCVFVSTAFFLSSLCVFISLLSSIPHIPTMTVGVLWLFSVTAESLLRFPLILYFYLFARYAGINSPIWIANKVVLLSIGAVLWLCIFLFSKEQIWE